MVKKKVIIEENAVRAKMGAMGIRSLRELNNRAGLGANTIYDVLGGGFQSTTLDALVSFFDCDPVEILGIVEENGSEAGVQAELRQSA